MILGMSLEALLMNFATALFLLASLSQIRTTFRRRKMGLKDFNIRAWLSCLSAVIAMATVGFLIGAWVTVIVESFQAIYHVLTLYWIFKYRSKKK